MTSHDPGSEDAWVRDLLSSLPPPALPDEVLARVQAALEAEQGAGIASVTPLRRTIGTSAIPRWAGLLAAAAAVATVAVTVPQLVTHTRHGVSASTASDSLAGTQQGATALAPGQGLSQKRALSVLSTHSGRAFTASSLSQDVQALLAGLSGSAGEAPAGTAPAPQYAVAAPGGTTGSATTSGGGTGAVSGPETNSSQQDAPPIDESCLAAIAGSGSVVAADYGTWNAESAILIVIDAPSDPHDYLAYVVGTDCVGSKPHILYEDRVAR